MKAKVSLGLSKLPVPQKIEKGRTIVTSMTANANFPSPVPDLTTVTTAIDDLDNAYQAAQLGGKTQYHLMNEKEAVLDDLLTQLALYVEATAAGQPSVIASAGMDVKRPPSHPADLTAPENIEAGTGAGEGDIKLSWKPVKGAASYIVEMAAIADTTTRAAITWTKVGFTTKARYMQHGLTSGIRYMFRVAAVGANGLGPWSDAATRMAV